MFGAEDVANEVVVKLVSDVLAVVAVFVAVVVVVFAAVGVDVVVLTLDAVAFAPTLSLLRSLVALTPVFVIVAAAGVAVAVDTVGKLSFLSTILSPFAVLLLLLLLLVVLVVVADTVVVFETLAAILFVVAELSAVEHGGVADSDVVCVGDVDRLGFVDLAADVDVDVVVVEFAALSRAPVFCCCSRCNLEMQKDAMVMLGKLLKANGNG